MDREPECSSPIERGTGVTGAERYLKRLCDRTFLSLWSYPGVYRDQGGAKEVCDLLVVFRNHIIIFSDKDCVFPDTGSLTNDWNRWYRRAIKKSAEQVWGAERWIKRHPDRLFVDPGCTQPFPIDLPDPATAVFHRVVVAHSGTARCRQEMGGGSGSLIIASNIIGDMHCAGEPNRGKPFWIGKVDPSRGFVHVFDDTSLGLVMRTVDTVSDFLGYLKKKEQFLSSDVGVFATGEEDLLAFYLKRLNENGEHDFVLDRPYAGVCITEGEWDAFQRNPQRLAQIAENEISYTWDRLIEKTNYHILTGTQYYASPGGVSNQEKITRIMAAENRLRRRMLSQALVGLMQRPVPPGCRAVRVFKPQEPGYPHYVFLLLAQPDYATYDEYRQVRYKLLEACCMVTKLRFPEAEDIVGIATEAGDGGIRSEDLLYLDARDWTDELNREATDLQNELQLLQDIRMFHTKAKEYPDVRADSTGVAVPEQRMKGRDRNAPCPCGSGRKFKHCCGR